MRKPITFTFLVLYGAFVIWGMTKVPFHPDESSLLYQSRDLESLITAPWSLAWDPAKNEDVDQQYRALNAPLGKYIIGLGRRLFGYGPSSVAVDWNWAKSWHENASLGALPERNLLLGGRLAVTLLLPVSLVLMYLCGKELGGERTGILAATFFGFNTLVLIHNRRAMSEGVMTVCLCLSILGMLIAHRKPLLAGLGASLAFSAKYSVAPMLLVNLIAIAWIPSSFKREPKRILKNL
ncbi:MAG: hypothetical protein GTO14_04110, partial [Anaerolineales bacterium]|nr:hypothetical protein [Anaerolineales bacterium]